MSERLIDTTERARTFLSTHIQPPKNYTDYAERQVQAWEAYARAAEAAGETVHPFWLRRNEDNTSAFTVHVDYVLPVDGKLLSYAAVHVSTSSVSEVQVWLPSEDNLSGTFVAMNEAYTLQSLGRAIEYAESSVELH
jgi:hypothetical protein